MVQNIVFIALGIAGLFFGGEFLVSSASRVARSFGISTLVIGLTVVAFGTSVPELLVSLDAATRGSSAISIGNVVGSNIANIGLILGLTGLIFPIAVEARVVRREIPLMIGISFLLYLMVSDGEISRLDGVILTLGIIAFTVGTIWQSLRETRQHSETDADATILSEPDAPVSRSREIGRLVIGLVLLLVGARLTVDGAISIARAINVSELVIAITMVAVGTSLPELAASLMAAFRKQDDISIGNIVGSNIFNILAILGITAIVRPISVDFGGMQRDFWIMIAFALLLFPFTLNRILGRWQAFFLLCAYFAFVALKFLG